MYRSAFSNVRTKIFRVKAKTLLNSTCYKSLKALYEERGSNIRDFLPGDTEWVVSKTLNFEEPRLVGMARIKKYDSYVYLDHLYVAQRFRKMGVATQILENIKEPIVLECLLYNTSALNLYEKNGFVTVYNCSMGQEPVIEGEGVICTLYRKTK